MARLEAPVMNTRRRAPASSASSTAYWMSGLSTTGSISLGLALVAGRKRVPRPATGNTAVRITGLETGIASFSSRGAHARVGALGPLEHGGLQAVPGATLRAVPVPADADQAAILTLITPPGFPDARQHQGEGSGIGQRLHSRAELRGNAGELRHLGSGRRGRQEPRELPRRDATTLAQPLAELLQNFRAAAGTGDGQYRRDDLERQPRRHLQRLQIQQQRTGTVTAALRKPRRQDVGPR